MTEKEVIVSRGSLPSVTEQKEFEIADSQGTSCKFFFMRNRSSVYIHVSRKNTINLPDKSHQVLVVFHLL